MSDQISIRTKLKLARVSLGLKIKDVVEQSNLSRNSISYLETEPKDVKAELEENSLVKYLLFLRRKGIDLNQIFENYDG